MPPKSVLSIAAVSALLFLSACERKIEEGDLKYIGYRYTQDSSAYTSIDSKNYLGASQYEALNASPHLKIHGSWCELTWIHTQPDDSKETKRVCFPTSNIHSFKWKE